MQTHQKTEINMQRELKFRVWDKLAERFTRCDEGYQGHYVLSLKGEFHNLQNGSGGDECIVQQYTGLKDQNGVEIYEGDIVVYREKNREIRIGQYSNGEDDIIGCFIQDPIVTHRNFGRGISDVTKCEVIGNIFETPELLES
jgi:uncharacterized phage protein (TIGR01671 family)